jgi:hypothetical protein
MAKKTKKRLLEVGDLVARVEAPTELHRVTARFPDYVRVLPYRRSGKEQFLISIRYGDRAIWAGDGSQWIWMGHN